MESQLVLGIETSCDETAAAVVESGRTIRANVIASQIDLHQRFGGVVPEIASRRHVELILPVVDRALQEAGASLDDLFGIAVTQGPGLVGSLLVGISAAKALAFARGLPLVGVNHLEGHICANFLAHPDLDTPLVCLTVSGGHTALVYVPRPGEYEVMGTTRDDAAGEAFDKIARVLGLGYPGGAAIDRLARGRDPGAIPLPRAMAGEGYEFSFSGLKTAALQFLERARREGRKVDIGEFAAAFQEAIVDVLVEKALRAAREKRVSRLVLSGGVAANSRLRERLARQGAALGLDVRWPPLELCTDNGAMIAAAGYFRLKAGERAPLSLNAEPALRL
ncbi:MAG: tRNA (adenosine(37)-N6)-threonylcarbamoyltransferase complex transferase subunit TsaD [Firmicutes bacterium]|nr:tRNA (adenosine(37)-N6)-threonylcarbamoyltransferase complex transferase subunit TsaD [Bacillota bacterium]